MCGASRRSTCASASSRSSSSAMPNTLRPSWRSSASARYTSIKQNDDPMSDDAGELTHVGQIATRKIYDGRVVNLAIDTVRFPDGSTGELEIMRHSGAAAVLPVLSDPDSDDPQILLIKQYRYASDGYMLEVPAGRPAPRACSRRW